MVLLGEFYTDYDNKPDKYDESSLSLYYFNPETGEVLSGVDN